MIVGVEKQEVMEKKVREGGSVGGFGVVGRGRKGGLWEEWCGEEVQGIRKGECWWGIEWVRERVG